MSQAEPKPKPDLTCCECGATNDPGASECWLCQRRDWRGPPRSSTSRMPATSGTSDAAWAIIAIVLGMVVLGGIAIAPGLIIVLLIFVLPAWAGAEWIAYRRRRRGLPTSATRKVAWILVLTILLPILLGVALFIAVWVICMSR
jgi:hypothetical protein